MTRSLLPLALCALTACASAPAARHLGSAPSPEIRLPDDAVPRAYRVELVARPSDPGFSGHEEIDVDLRAATPILWLDALGLNVTRAALRQGGQVIAASLRAPDADGKAALALAAPAQAGPATLVFSWTATYGTQNEGLYKVVFEGRPYLVTQFEATSARRAFPCFDEPRFKAKLSLRITTAAGLTVAANAPVARVAPAPGGQQTVFETTAPLPTYLYAWAVGPFDVVRAPPIPPSVVRKDPTPLCGLAPKGHGAKLSLALAEAPALVRSEEAYFGVPYPWKKLCLVSVPDFEAGAMENPGLITFRSSVLELDPARASVLSRKHMAIDVAHELAHQWFGDEVTLAWWNDVWLNEAFATWMEDRTMAAVHPNMRMALSRAENADRSMRDDALASARQIRQPIRTTADIHSAFDGITYDKGEAVIAMFEKWLGPAVFRAGIHAYLVAHRDGVATSADLLAALSKQSGRDVATPFDTFLDQPGVPLVRAALACDAKGARLTLSQTRYLPKGSAGSRTLRWQIPVCARYDRDGQPAQACTLLTEATGALPLPSKRCPAWVQPNADLAGYYRWRLPGAQLQAVARAPLHGVDRFAVATSIRAGFDASALSASDAFPALASYANDPNPEIALAYADLADEVIQTVADDAWRARVRAKVAVTYAPALAQVGLVDRPGEGDAAVERRVAVVAAMADVAADPGTRAALAKLGRAFLGADADGALHPGAVAPELTTLAVAQAVEADPALFPAVVAHLFAEPDETVHVQLLHALDALRTPALAERVRALALEPRMRANEVLSPFWRQARDVRTRDAAWAAVRAHYFEIAARLGPEAHGYLPFLAGDGCTLAYAKQVEAFFGPKVKSDPELARPLAQELEAIRLCAVRADSQRSGARAYFGAR